MTQSNLKRHGAQWGGLAVALILLGVAPYLVNDFKLSEILTEALFLGIVAASLIFLAGYGGMVSLAQVAFAGIAGFTAANLVLADGGVKTAWNPWVAAILALMIATLVGLIFGAVAARSEGIYFLMITLAFGVLVFFFWGQVTQLSGFGGVNNVDAPDIVSTPRTDPGNVYYISLVVALAVYLGLKYIVRTPFGIALQGIRDDPTRMRALGYNIFLYRTLAMGFAAFTAGLGGILFVWSRTRIDPGDVDIGGIIDVLIIAVIGGLFWIEGAWVGAFAFGWLEFYSKDIGFVGVERFNTLLGIIFLIIVLLSPGGLLGIWESARGFGKRAMTTWRKDEPPEPAVER